jgi:hypothetical protein
MPWGRRSEYEREYQAWADRKFRKEPFSLKEKVVAGRDRMRF